MDIVVDADCIIAGALTSSGATSRLLDAWLDGEFELVVCPQLIYEVKKSMLHPRIASKYDITAEEVEALVTRLGEEGLLYEDPVDPPRVVPGDPNDDYLVALALSADAEFLVTRDRHFEDVSVEGLQITSPRRTMRLLEGA